MILEFSLPNLMARMTEAIVHSVAASEGQKLAVGQALMDLTVDLSAVYLHDCPPISLYRIVVRETVWLRELRVARNSRPALGDLLARFSTLPDEPLDASATRPLRVSVAGVIPQSEDQLW